MALTKHREGSIRELWSLGFPLMLSSFSVMFMLFVDRLLLARYSTDALNAAVNATTLGWGFYFGWMVMCSIAEVFVAQYNGADQKHKFGEPVWQMIWLALASVLCFLPLAMWGDKWFYGSSPDYEMERSYFSWMMLFGPSFPLYTALCGFFVGQGKTRIITILAIIANFINAVLDVILIYGIEGWVPSLGIAGAAIATSGSGIFQSAVLGYIFLRKENRENHGTANYHFRYKPFLQCIRVGLPGAVFVSCESLGWASFYWMMTLVGDTYITIVGICQSIAILFYFFAEGINKASTAIAGNLIGGKRTNIIKDVLAAGARLHLIFFFALVGLFFLASEQLVLLFLPEEKAFELYDSLFICIFFILISLLFEGLRLLLAGILTAAGDTVFLLTAGTLSVWAFLVLPVYVFVVHGQAPVEVASFFCIFYGACASVIYLWRFRAGKWKTNSIIIATDDAANAVQSL